MTQETVPDEAFTPDDWEYISVCVAADIRKDREHGHDISADKHYGIWLKIQTHRTEEEEV
jgi:hypothetical protein